MPRLTERREMRTTILFLMVLLAGCDDYGARRYELTEGKDGAYLVDIRTGRVWVKNSDPTGGAFYPVKILRDSSEQAPLNQLASNDREFKHMYKDGYRTSNQYSYKPNTWSDLFQGLGK